MRFPGHLTSTPTSGTSRAASSATSGSSLSTPIRIGRVEPLVRIDVERLEQQRVVARLRQPVRNRGEHLSEEDQREVAMPGVVAHDRRNEPRLLRNERARRPVDAVAQGSRRVPHSLSSPHAYVPLVIERA